MSKIITAIIILILLVTDIFFGVKYFLIQKQLNESERLSKINSGIVAFDKLFVSKVLRSQGEVSYEDRLRLENAVTVIGDNDLLGSWHSFLASTTEQEAQERALVLLELIPNKIVY